MNPEGRDETDRTVVSQQSTNFPHLRTSKLSAQIDNPAQHFELWCASADAVSSAESKGIPEFLMFVTRTIPPD
jgi:hypothetical protein